MSPHYRMAYRHIIVWHTATLPYGALPHYRVARRHITVWRIAILFPKHYSYNPFSFKYPAISTCTALAASPAASANRSDLSA